MGIHIPARNLAAVAVGYVAGAGLYPYLPDDTPLGLMVAFLLPITGLATCVLLGSLWNRDPIRIHEPNLEATYEAIVFRIVLFVTAVQLVVVIGLLERAGVFPQTLRPVLSRIVPVSLGVALMAIGNLLPRMKPNVVIGIRTARTLADQAAWSRTNRIAGYVAVGLGIVLILTGAFMSPGTPRAQVMSAAGLGAVILLVVQVRLKPDTTYGGQTS